ncbi:hypothetical protein MLN07_025325, partial [Escherichia coli]|nr:hypothetical protein [Escherichia coli]
LILVLVFVTNYQLQKYAQFVTSVTKRVLLCGLLVFLIWYNRYKGIQKSKEILQRKTAIT